ncbi:MAG: hypothetical protein ACFFDN_24425 [Candidatus Hodarchaeota archaeon]
MIIRTQKEKDYTVVNNHFVKNPDLSMQAKGLMIYLLSLPNNWEIHINELPGHFTDGITSIRNTVKELIEAGYLDDAGLKQDKSGHFVERSYTVCEKPFVLS